MTKDPIKKSPNGTYYFRANWGYHPTTGKQLQKYCSGYVTKKEAREEYSKLILQNPLEMFNQKEAVTFRHYAEEIFLPWYKTQVKEQTFENRKPTLLKHFPYFYNLSASEIEPIHVQNWQLELTKRGLSRSYIRCIQGLFSLSMDRAIVLGLATINPSKVIGNVKKEKIKVDFWTKHEFESVISLIYKADYYQHFLFVSLWLLFMTGIRIGEATALQWDDINFETGILNITKTLYYRRSDNYKFVEPKTKASMRQIALDEDTLKELRHWKSIQAQILDTSFVLSYNGIPTQKCTIAHAITRYSKLAGVHRIKLHALRHSHASLLIEMGENPLIIKDRLGHEDIETTLGTYGHLYPNSNFEVANKLKGIISFCPSTKNNDTSPSNQFTTNYLRKNIKMQSQCNSTN